MTPRPIRVWDLPTRIVHWLLALFVVTSIVTAKIGGNAMVWHGRFGLTVFGLVVFRVVWGVVGSTYARFAQFVRGPGAIRDYLNGHWRGVGHNPLGALSVLALLGLMSIQSLAGMLSNDDIAFQGPLYALVSSDLSNWISGLHRQAEWVLYGLVGIHVAAVFYYTHVRKDDLIAPMIRGTREVSDPTVEPARGGGAGAFMFALVVAVLAVWIASGGLLPPPPSPAPTPDW
jgi:cytochrome b